MNRTVAEGALILAPHGRDAAIAAAMLREAGLEASSVPDLASFVSALRGVPMLNGQTGELMEERHT